MKSKTAAALLSIFLLLTMLPSLAFAGSRATRLERERNLNLQRLHDYAMAGEFPRNVDTGGRAMYFLDSEGRPCAVAYLMIQSGRYDDVLAISRANNAVRIGPDTGGAVAAWIRTSGFSLSDVMKIQEPDGYTFSRVVPAQTVATGPVDDPVSADRARIQARLLRVIAELRARG